MKNRMILMSSEGPTDHQLTTNYLSTEFVPPVVIVPSAKIQFSSFASEKTIVTVVTCLRKSLNCTLLSM